MPKVDWDKPIQTTSNLKARVICRDLKSDRSIVVAIVASITGNEFTINVNENGFHRSYQIINVKEQIKGKLYLVVSMCLGEIRSITYTSLAQATLGQKVFKSSIIIEVDVDTNSTQPTFAKIVED